MKKHLKHLTAILASLAVGLTLAGCAGEAGQSTDSDPNSLSTISPGVLRVGTVTDNKPYSYIDGGVNAGLDIDVMTEFATRQNLKIEFVQIEFASLIPSVVNGQIDVAAASISNTEERQKIVDFSDPYMIGPIAIMAKKGSGITADTASLEGVRLGLIQGTIQDGYATEHDFKADIVRFPDSNSGVAALKTGTIDGFFTDAPLAALYAAEDSSLEMPIAIYDDQSPFGMAFNKKNKGLSAAFNTDLKAMIEDGTLAQMQEKNLPDLPVKDIFKPKS